MALMVKKVETHAPEMVTDANAQALVTIRANPMFNIAERAIVFPCTPTELHRGIVAYNAGALLQDAFPFLDADFREILKTGLTPADWIFG